MVGITFGAFDLCHAGHICLFKKAKERCDYLIVGLQVDNGRSSESVSERAIRLNSIKYIDEVIPYETEEELEELLRLLQPDIRFLGTEYKKRKITGKNITPICYITREHHQSSNNLRVK
jgi:glycerol-3-phosphate cytidylyltransferase